MRIQLAIAPRSVLIYPALLSGFFIILGMGYLVREAIFVSTDSVPFIILNAIPAFMMGIGIFLFYYKYWKNIKYGFVVDTSGLSWAITRFFSPNIIDVRWEHIRSLKVKTDCEGIECIYILIRKDFLEKYEEITHKRHDNHKSRLIYIYNELWSWSPYISRCGLYNVLNTMRRQYSRLADSRSS